MHGAGDPGLRNIRCAHVAAPWAIIGPPHSGLSGKWCGRLWFGFLVLGSWFWFLVLGSWFLVLGSWFLVLGSWLIMGGAWFVVRGAWCLVGEGHLGSCVLGSCDLVGHDRRLVDFIRALLGDRPD